MTFFKSLLTKKKKELEYYWQIKKSERKKNVKEKRGKEERTLQRIPSSLKCMWMTNIIRQILITCQFEVRVRVSMSTFHVVLMRFFTYNHFVSSFPFFSLLLCTNRILILQCEDWTRNIYQQVQTFVNLYRLIAMGYAATHFYA